MGDAVESHALERFCFRLGSVLAEFPHELLVETDIPRTADRLVVDGMLASDPIPRVGRWHAPANADRCRSGLG